MTLVQLIFSSILILLVLILLFYMRKDKIKEYNELEESLNRFKYLFSKHLSMDSIQSFKLKRAAYWPDIFIYFVDSTGRLYYLNDTHNGLKLDIFKYQVLYSEDLSHDDILIKEKLYIPFKLEHSWFQRKRRKELEAEIDNLLRFLSACQSYYEYHIEKEAGVIEKERSGKIKTKKYIIEHFLLNKFAGKENG